MKVDDHFYADDPNVGHPDVRTMPNNADYFFLGNGLIEAAIQVCSIKGATPIGLLLMDPGRFGPKRAALTMDDESGLESTALGLEIGDTPFVLDPTQVNARWSTDRPYPCVLIDYVAGALDVAERFYCVDLTTAQLIREIGLHNTSESPLDVSLSTGIPSHRLENRMAVAADERQTLFVEYQIGPGNDGNDGNDGDDGDAPPSVSIAWIEAPEPSLEWLESNLKVARCTFHDAALDHLFEAAKAQLPAVVSSTGAMDASIWQYNHEWTRDSAMVTVGLTMLGHFEVAEKMLERLLLELVTPDGATVDSGSIRGISEAELDQNGILLYALKTFADWSGDLRLIRSHWDRICALAEFPLRRDFDHPETSLRCNSREFWDRSAMHGIEPGFELNYQVYVSHGLTCAADLASRLGHEDLSERWLRTADNLKRDLLENPDWGLVNNGRLIKRRRADGSIQEDISARDRSGFPEGIPLLANGPHLLEPDASNALAVAIRFIEPEGKLAANTLTHIDALWNQSWDGGGYSRYNVTSEPDSPGPWPVASVFVARAWMEHGNHEKVWAVLRWLASAPGSKAGTFFEFYGPRPIPPWPQVGPLPWTWAELAILFIQHILGVRPNGHDLVVEPCLLPGLHEIEADLRVANQRLRIRASGAKPDTNLEVWFAGARWTSESGKLSIPKYLDL